MTRIFCINVWFKRNKLWIDKIKYHGYLSALTVGFFLPVRHHFHVSFHLLIKQKKELKREINLLRALTSDDRVVIALFIQMFIIRMFHFIFHFVCCLTLNDRRVFFLLVSVNKRNAFTRHRRVDDCWKVSLLPWDFAHLKFHGKPLKFSQSLKL